MTKNSVHCAWYLRNHTPYDCHLFYTCVKWLYLQAIISFFQNFDFLGCKGVKRAKNGSKWQEILSIALHIWGTIDCMTIIYVCKMIISLGVFSIFFSKLLILWVHRRVKGQKTVQNDKKLCLSCSISQEPCIIWLSFMV